MKLKGNIISKSQGGNAIFERSEGMSTRIGSLLELNRHIYADCEQRLIMSLHAVEARPLRTLLRQLKGSSASPPTAPQVEHPVHTEYFILTSS